MATGIITMPKELHFGNRIGVNTPFTAPNDGIVEIQLRAAAAGRLYAQYNTSFSAFLDGYTEKDAYIMGTFPIKKGQIISPFSKVNVSSDAYYYTPLEY